MTPCQQLKLAPEIHLRLRQALDKTGWNLRNNSGRGRLFDFRIFRGFLANEFSSVQLDTAVESAI
jgi:hypothetical protein